MKLDKVSSNFDDLNGYQFEHYLKDLFKALGYSSLTTKPTGDQGADLIISKDGIKTVVQAIQQVVAAISHYGTDEALVVCTSTYTQSAIELSKSNNIGLWDRQKLKQVVNDINTKK